MSTKDFSLLMLVCLIWGFNLVAIRLGLTDFPPVLFALLRFTVLSAILAPWLRWHRGQMGPLMTAAVFSGGLNFGLLFYGMSLTDNVAMVAIATQLGMPFTTLLSVALLGETVRWRRWLGITLSFLGVMIMGFDARVFSQGAALVLVSASAFVGALGLIAIKRVQNVKPIELQAWFATTSWPALLPLTLLLEHDQIRAISGATRVGWAALAYVALVSSLIGHTSYYFLIQRYPVNAITPFTVLAPLVSVICSITMLGNELSERLIVGGTLTLIGVLIIALREQKIVDTGT